MKVKLILPAITEAKSQYYRAIKYSLFPPLGLATLAGYLLDDDQIVIQDEHAEKLDLDDQPDLVAIETYITAANRAYQIADHYRAKGCYVCIGGLHATAAPEQAAMHANTVFTGPGEDTWPRFLSDFRAGAPAKLYASTIRNLTGAPLPRRDLLKLYRYFVPNTMIVSRGCPHHCDFCYKDSFFAGGKSYYTMPIDRAMQEMHTLGGKHLYFLDDNLFANPKFAEELMAAMQGEGRLWQAAGTVQSILDQPELFKKAADSGLRSLFIGFETLNQKSLRSVNKVQNLGRQYNQAIGILRDLGVMINGSFVFGMDADGPEVFDATVEWAVRQGIQTATFHILTPYPGTALHARLKQEGRILTDDTELYDTRHAVFAHPRMTTTQIEDGYWRAYKNFYTWRNIARASEPAGTLTGRMRHIAYVGAWKKIEPFWRAVIWAKRLPSMTPVLEAVLSQFGLRKSQRDERVIKLPGNAIATSGGTQEIPSPQAFPAPTTQEIQTRASA